MNTKQFKVHYIYRTWSNGLTSSGECAVPHISISGKWLADAGFNVGDTIKVEYGDGKVIIQNVSKPPHTVF